MMKSREEPAAPDSTGPVRDESDTAAQPVHRRTDAASAVRRAATGAAASALYLGAPAFSEAAVVENTASFSVPAGLGAADTFWDVNGSGTPDIKFDPTFISSIDFSGASSPEVSLLEGGGFELGYGGPVSPADGLIGTQRFLPGQVVSASALTNSYYFYNSPPSGSSTYASQPAELLDDGSVVPGDFAPPNTTGFIGFAFRDGLTADPSDSIFFGWAEVEFNTAKERLEVIRWAYEDQPNTPITIPSAPSNNAMIALGLLALGAPAQRLWRKPSETQASD